MKKVVVMFAITGTLLVVACGGSENDAKVNEEPVEALKQISPSDNPDYKKGLALVANSDCLTCHKINEAATGPSYADVAAKYAGADDAQITMLANTIIKGGVGNWGQVPMTPHPDISEADAKQMVKYVLLLKK